MNLEESGKDFADALLETLQGTGLTTQLIDPGEAFESGCYFGAVQGYKRGVNQMIVDIPKLLPDIFNQIVESNYDMKINWPEKFKELILNKVFDIDINKR